MSLDDLPPAERERLANIHAFARDNRLTKDERNAQLAAIREWSEAAARTEYDTNGYPIELGYN